MTNKIFLDPEKMVIVSKDREYDEIKGKVVNR